MRVSKSLLVASAAAFFLSGVMASIASAQTEAESKSYVVCNQYDECWRVHEKVTNYPGDVQITWHDDAWYQAHQHDSHWRWLADPRDDHGWYDREGTWHAFSDSPRP